jgi:hypothetical protein
VPLDGGWVGGGRGGSGIRSQGLALFGNAPRRAASVCAVPRVHYVTARRRSLTVSPDNSRIYDRVDGVIVGGHHPPSSVLFPSCGCEACADDSLEVGRNKCECACLAFADGAVRSRESLLQNRPTDWLPVALLRSSSNALAPPRSSLARSMSLEFSPATGKE